MFVCFNKYYCFLKKKKTPMINSCVSNIIQSLANTYAHCCKVCGKTCVPRRIILRGKVNGCLKGIDLRFIFRNFYQKNKFNVFDSFL